MDYNDEPGICRACWGLGSLACDVCCGADWERVVIAHCMPCDDTGLIDCDECHGRGWRW